MLKSWPVRYQIRLGAGLLFLVILGLCLASVQGVYRFRNLTKSIRQRALELPLAVNMGQAVSDLRRINAQASMLDSDPRSIGGSFFFGKEPESPLGLRTAFYNQKLKVRATFLAYQEQLELEPTADDRLAYTSSEEMAVANIYRALDRIDRNTDENRDWYVHTQVSAAVLESDLEELQHEVQRIPSLLKQRMDEFATVVRAEYNAWYAWTFGMTAVAFLSLGLLYMIAKRSIFQPLETLIRGSRRVAKGEYDFRIKLNVEGEVAELAAALNDMTENFQSIKNDLDEKVRQRTKEVIRSEQLASVGFMAAGLAHEINNPLAAIAWSAEALESRVQELLYDLTDETTHETYGKEITTILKYLRRIQDEAFRCKGITSGLLDYSRLDDKEKHPTEMVELIQAVIDMVTPAKKYLGRNIHFHGKSPVYGMVNAQELKQVTLNLITNALESIEQTGNVWIELEQRHGHVVIEVRDDGCGMTDEVQAHLFEPFFTRRVDGSGTGLGLAITYRIIEEHQGTIQAVSAGPGKGSTFTISLPTVKHEEKRQSFAA
ncbi:MAG: HAMP domain-containing sensor histidine kinase [Pirellulaceae bacterium]|nr:HAMP domain-containing sensor histidine kinase [Pirellulaceae bacterium]